MNAARFIGAAASVVAPLLVAQPVQAGDNAAAGAARAWRQTHERQILDDFFAFLKIPNVSSDLPNVRRNAEHLVQAMQKRGLSPRLLEVPGASPAVYGEILVPGATHTYVFYSHYDGQPLDAKEWATPPFEPTFRTARLDRGGQVMPFPAPGQSIDPEWRIQARSASDAKGAIFSLLSAVDALNAAGAKPHANIKFIFEGEEEMESPHLARILSANKELLAGDLWFICDGPENPNGRLTIVFGARGIQKVEITVYGAKRALHSGHYGNWAPNPALMLAQLLASMKDADGRVLVENFYDGVIPLNAIELEAIAESATDAAQKKELALGRVDGGGKSLGELINQPSLNIRGISSGRIGEQAANIIPATATAAIDLRLVKGVTKEGQAERLIAHIRKQGYHVVTTDPDDATRLAHPRIAKVVVDAGGYNAVRTPMDLPLAQRVLAVARSVRPVAVQPTSGGSVPLDMIVDILGTRTISVSVVNYDNNQHSSNEDIKLMNLWNGIETDAALMMME
ncbi:MAG: M20/M25/M40 family metallo-hydrolase [Bradyrhizobiaceae bacterium]|nr:M20/M25/M40 family metallo-hydrolase [Bradyrhizobiaceae bacterium]